MLKKKNLLAQAAQVVIHIAAWTILFMLPFIFVPTNWRGGENPFRTERFITSIIVSNVLLIVLYYFNRWWLIPRVLGRKQPVIYTLSVIAYFVAYLTVLYFIHEHFEQLRLQANPQEHRHHFLWMGPVMFFLLVFVISMGSTVISQWFRAEDIQKETSRQQLQTELSLLKSQINPHFLFNTLNSIYTLSMASSELTSDAVLKLSRIMRYTLEESQRDEVKLSQEIDFIRSYLDLQKLRLTDNVTVIFKTEGPVENVLFAPLLFIPFIENAFKYGISTHHTSAVRIGIRASESELWFECENRIFPSSMRQESTGMGIANAERRLALLYPGRHRLTIDSKDDTFRVNLTISLK